MSSPPPRKRQRSYKACIPCRQLKKRCDGESPCGTCVRFRHKCEYSGPRPVIASSTPKSGFTNNSPTPGRNDENQTFSLSADHNIYDPERQRFFDTSSAIAFPRMLGIHLGAARAPKLHSWAWHLGLRAEFPLDATDVTKIISLDDMIFYSNQFFALVAPTFDMLCQEEFTRRARLRWNGKTDNDPFYFDPVICGVTALGCYFSQQAETTTETALVAAAKDQLEALGMRPPTVDTTCAWLLRAIYLRATSRPIASWMATCTAMHSAEASGVHKSLESISIIYPHPDAAPQNDEPAALYRRKVFWMARSIHALFSYEYSRPRIHTPNPTAARVDSDVSTSARDLIQLADQIPANAQVCQDQNDILETRALLDYISSSAISKGPASFIAADIALAAYRHLKPWLSNQCPDSDATIPQLLLIGSYAMEIIHEFVSAGKTPAHQDQGRYIPPWWSLIMAPFHYLLVLLSLDTPQSFTRIPFALQVLREVASNFDNHLTRESVQNALTLIRLSQRKKERDVGILNKALIEAEIEVSVPSEGAQETPREHGTEVQTGSGNVVDFVPNGQVPQKSTVFSTPFASFNGDPGVNGFGDNYQVGLGKKPGAYLDWDALFEDLDWI